MRVNEELRLRQAASITTEDLPYLLPTDVLWVTDRVRLESNQLIWPDCGMQQRVPPKNLLHSFIKLHKSDNEAILKFAQKWGRLSLCQHGFPWTHSRAPVFPLIREKMNSTWCTWQLEESIDSWKKWASKFNAILNLAARIYQRRHGEINDWRLVFEDSGWTQASYYLGHENSQDINEVFDGYWTSHTFTAERMWLMDIVNNYLEWGCVRPRLQLISDHYKDIGPRIVISGEVNTALFGVLALQLMMSISGINSAAICTACSRTYSRERRPKTGQANYCPNKSCQMAARREATRRWRIANKERQKLNDEKSTQRKRTEVKNGKARAK